MSVIAIERRIDGALASADQATLLIKNRAGVTIVPTTTIVPTSAGIYSYTTSYIAPGAYTATWTFIVSGYADDVVVRPFVVDAPLQAAAGFTLADLEAAIAQRAGQYRKVYTGNASSSTTVQSARLKSSQNLGSFETEFVLRRGIFRDGTLVPGFIDDDRVRGITSYTASSGVLEVDRPYTLTPLQDEQIELMYLEPEFELRPAALEGLKRCFFWDTLTIASVGGTTLLDLTAVVPWLLDPAWIKNVDYSSSSRLPPSRISWYDPYRAGQSIMLQTQGVQTGSLLVTVLRPYHSYVNGELSFTGPNDDLDVLTGSGPNALEYAAWAGILEVWKANPERLEPVSHTGMRTTRKEAADEFTKHSLLVVDQIPERLRHRYDSYPDITQIGNLAEPVT